MNHYHWFFKRWNIGKILGIPLYFHWSLPVPLIILLPTQISQVGWPQGGMSLLSIPLAMLIVTLHELGHCAAASLFKISTKSITLTGIGGIASIQEKPIPCPKENLIVAVAGPAVNVAIAIIMLLTVGLPTGSMIQSLGENPFSSAINLYTVAFVVNITLLLFNLLPIYPMDGGRILKEISEILLGRKIAGFTILTACIALGAPAAILLASNKIIIGAWTVSMMSILGIEEGLTILQQERKKSLKTPPGNIHKE